MENIKDIIVVKIIDDKQLIISIGTDDGTKVNDIFEIYEVGEEVKNPINGENLGRLDFIKATIVAVQVTPKMSVCQSKENIATGSALRTLAVFETLSNIMTIPLDVDLEEVTGRFEPEDKRIKIGDKVRKVN